MYFACEASWLRLMTLVALRKDHAAESSLAERLEALFSRGEHQCTECWLRAGGMAGHVCGVTSCMQGSVLGLSSNMVRYIPCWLCWLRLSAHICPQYPLTFSLKLP